MSTPTPSVPANDVRRLDLRPLLSPSSIAVIGASSDVAKMGGRLVKYPLRHAYPGVLFPVNPRGGEIQGLKAYRDILEVPGSVDLAVLVVPAEQVVATLEQCAEKGVRAALILASGFAEASEEGRQLQDRVAEIAQRTGMRMCGPNSNGLVNMHERIVASSNPTLEADLVPGRIAVVSQSGGLGLGSILYLGQKRHIGFSYHISSGNEADVEAADYVRYLLDDPNTDVIALLVEGFKSARKFAAVADLAAERRKPIVVMKLGRTPLGTQIASSHTALLAGSDRSHRAVFEQRGIIQVNDFDDLYEVAALFANTPLPQGDAIGMISPSGGIAILSADLCSDLGLTLANLSPATRDGIAALLPSFAAIQNPIDLTAIGTSDPTIYPRCIELMLNDPNVHVLVLALTVNLNYDSLMEFISRAAHSASKPIICIGAGDGLAGRGFVILEEGQVPLFRSFTKGFAAVRHLIRYADYLRERSGGRTGPAVVPVGDAAAKARVALQGRSGVQTEAFSKSLLQAYGIPTTREELATSSAGAITAAVRIGYPVVLKGMSRQLPHKTDVGIVHLNLRDKEMVATAYADIVRRVAELPNAQLDGVLIQEMVTQGTEVIVGFSQDPQFGPIVLFGLGGIFVEALQDVVVRVAPLSRRDAEAMVETIKGAKVLQGARNRPPADTEAIIDLLLRVSQMAVDLEDQIVELDLNPVVVFERGKGLKAVDALAILKS